MASAWSSSFNDDLAERWDEYVHCQSRLRIEGPFLSKLLANCRDDLILDAAMAQGCEVLFLASCGFKVIGNEIDNRLRRRAESAARQADVRIQFSSIDWRDLEYYFEPASVGAVLILGNSLGLLANAADRRRVCDQVYKILKPGGVFLVDSRNYDYMFRSKKRILDGDFRYSGRFMYCEHGIVGRPIIIEEGRVRLACFDKFTGRQLGYFDVYPFRGDELCRLVRGSGFRSIRKVIDLGLHAKGSHWDFMTLVCKKGI